MPNVQTEDYIHLILPFITEKKIISALSSWNLDVNQMFFSKGFKITGSNNSLHIGAEI